MRQDGYTQHTCSVCGHQYQDNFVKAFFADDIHVSVMDEQNQDKPYKISLSDDATLCMVQATETNNVQYLRMTVADNRFMQ